MQMADRMLVCGVALNFIDFVRQSATLINLQIHQKIGFK